MSASEYQIACYYFPNYHADRRNEVVHGPGWTEWELVRRAEPRFPGHRQPRVPLWGYQDESSPEVAAHKIEAATQHGITALIWDWYWYDDGPFLSGALERGFLQAANVDRIGFALMWANHDWADIHPAKRRTTPPVLYHGAVSRAGFEAAAETVIGRFFSHPSYWRVNGGLYFSIYELHTLVEGLGGIEPTRRALDDLRIGTRAAGLGEVHLNAVAWGIRSRPDEGIADANELLHRLGFDSITSYVWTHHAPMPDFPETAYETVMEASVQDWHRLSQAYALPYYPNVTVGWDSSPRTVQSDVFENLGYPFTPVLTGNTPQALQTALELARDFLDQSHAVPKVLTVNAWNEWTEGSYLEPDTQHGMSYLQAIRRVFAP